MKLPIYASPERLTAGITTSRATAVCQMPWLIGGGNGTFATPHPLRPDGRQVLRQG